MVAITTHATPVNPQDKALAALKQVISNLAEVPEEECRRVRSRVFSAKRIAQYHIASFLGITDVALSRIRKKIGLTAAAEKNGRN